MYIIVGVNHERHSQYAWSLGTETYIKKNAIGMKTRGNLRLMMSLTNGVCFFCMSDPKLLQAYLKDPVSPGRQVFVSY